MKINKKAMTMGMAVLLVGLLYLGTINVMAQPTAPTIPKVDVTITQPQTPQDYVDNIKILILMTVLTLLPSIIIMTTSFIRTVVVFSLFKNAIGAQQAIPREVLIGLSIFLTVFIMYPTFQIMKADAIDPYLNGKITQQQAYDKGKAPLKKFMLKQTKEKDIKLFLELGNLEHTLKTTKDDKNPEKVIYDYSSVPLRAIIPAFIISELKTAFEIGFLLYIPFLIIDLVTGSILMSMGMMMVPPVMISLPFKLLIFVMVDGWNLLIRALILSFR